MFYRFIKDEAGRTGTEYMIMVMMTCISAMFISLLAGDIVSDLTAELDKARVAVEEVKTKGFIVARK